MNNPFKAFIFSLLKKETPNFVCGMLGKNHQWRPLSHKKKLRNLKKAQTLPEWLFAKINFDQWPTIIFHAVHRGNTRVHTDHLLDGWVVRVSCAVSVVVEFSSIIFHATAVFFCSGRMCECVWARVTVILRNDAIKFIIFLLYLFSPKQCRWPARAWWLAIQRSTTYQQKLKVIRRRRLTFITDGSLFYMSWGRFENGSKVKNL